MAASFEARLRASRRLLLLLALGGGGLAAVVARQRAALHAAEAEAVQAPPPRAPTPVEPAGGGAEPTAPAPRNRPATPAVDRVFLERLRLILRLVVPSWRSEEAGLLYVQSGLLVSRTLLSLRLARLGGDGLRAVVRRNWPSFRLTLSDFFLTGLCSAVVNAGLKYLQSCITVAFRRRLTRHTHRLYLADGFFYRAAVLRVGNLDNADQRIVEDLNQWCVTVADLYSRTFKPLLDVVLSTRRMAKTLGLGGLAILYTYFGLSGALVRAASPPLAKLVAAEASLEGDFRRAHARLIAHAEEVAFLGGAPREEVLLNERLGECAAFAGRLHLLRLRQAVLDGFFLKYFASCVGWPVLALPLLLRGGAPGGAAAGEEDAAETAARYRESDTLMQRSSASLGELLLVHKKLQKLAGLTSRVAELLEAVERAPPPPPPPRPAPAGGPAQAAGELRLVQGGSVRFRGVSVRSPDGRLLLAGLNLDVGPGRSVVVTGPNGGGKTSLFRVLAGLWPPAAGVVSRPSAGAGGGGGGGGGGGADPRALFYVPQRPYLVSGSLRDQVTYPLRCAPGGPADAAAMSALARVGLSRLLSAGSDGPGGGLDARRHDWQDVLSGGEAQRLGLARVFFHSPAFAVLDEATSAINPEEEGALYGALAASGVAVFSIAHRPSLRRYHHAELRVEADGRGGWTLTELEGGGGAAGGGSRQGQAAQPPGG